MLRGVVELEGGDAGEVAGIAGDEGEVVTEGGRRDEEVRVAHQLTLAPELATDAGESPQEGPGKRQDVHPAQEVPEAPFVLTLVPAVVNAFIDSPKVIRLMAMPAGPSEVRSWMA